MKIGRVQWTARPHLIVAFVRTGSETLRGLPEGIRSGPLPWSAYAARRFKGAIALRAGNE